MVYLVWASFFVSLVLMWAGHLIYPGGDLEAYSGIFFIVCCLSWIGLWTVFYPGGFIVNKKGRFRNPLKVGK